jgi:hypothetical protein
MDRQVGSQRRHVHGQVQVPSFSRVEVQGELLIPIEPSHSGISLGDRKFEDAVEVLSTAPAEDCQK